MGQAFNYALEQTFFQMSARGTAEFKIAYIHQTPDILFLKYSVNL